MTLVEVAYNAGVAAALEKVAAPAKKPPKVDMATDIATRGGMGLMGAAGGGLLGSLFGPDEGAGKYVAPTLGVGAGGTLGALAPNVMAGVGTGVAGGALGTLLGELSGDALREPLGIEGLKPILGRVGRIGGAIGGAHLGYRGMKALRGE